MSAPKKIFISSLVLFAFIGTVALVKKGHREKAEKSYAKAVEFESVDEESLTEEKEVTLTSETTYLNPVQDALSEEKKDIVWRLFATGKEQLPIVKTISYRSRVPWLKDRPAWIADYASYHGTSRHFIARSLNKKPDYLTQKISTGDRFNVLNKDLNIHFHLVVDCSRCKMWFFYHDLDLYERVLLKTYKVGVGRLSPYESSGLLTPHGTYLLGDKVVTYKPGTQGYFQDKEVEMVQVFGTRWLPLEEISEDGDNPHGSGLHGAPWVFDQESGEYKENQETIGHYESDGCIRLRQVDIEELYSIVITKKTFVSIVSDFKDAQLPGIEVDK